MVRTTALIGALLLAGCDGGQPVTAADAASAIPITAENLVLEFRSNGVAAGERYQGPVIVEGVVERVTAASGGVANVSFRARGGAFGAGMTPASESWAAQLQPGMRAAVLCPRPLYVLGAVISRQCVPHDLAPVATKRARRNKHSR